MPSSGVSTKTQGRERWRDPKSRELRRLPGRARDVDGIDRHTGLRDVRVDAEHLRAGWDVEQLEVAARVARRRHATECEAHPGDRVRPRT